MATVTGDFQIDFSGEANASPYTNASFTALNGDFQIVSGVLKPSNTGTWRQFRLNDTPSSTTVVSKIEISGNSAQANDESQPAITDTSGNGYILRLNGTYVRIQVLANYVLTASVGATLTESWVNGDTFELQLNTSTGDLVARHNGVDIISGENDTTYTTGLGASMVMQYDSGNNHGVISFAADGYTASASITQTDTTPEDGVQQTVTCSGMTGPITAATLGGYDILSLISGTDPASPITYTLDMSAIEASQGAPRIGETSTLSFTTATDGAVTTDVTIQPKTGWARVVLAGTLDKSANGYLATLDADLGVTSAVGDIIYYDASSNAAITAAGVYTSDLTTAGQNTPFVIQQGGSATTVSTSEGGAFYPYGEAGGSDSKVVQSINISNLRIGL